VFTVRGYFCWARQRDFASLFPLDRYAWVCFDVLCFVLGLSRVSLVAKSQVIFMVCFVVLSY
jgi:hypothetical protein